MPCDLDHCLKEKEDTEKPIRKCCLKVLSENEKKNRFKKKTGVDYDDNFHNTYGFEPKSEQELIENNRINKLLEKAVLSKVAKENREHMGDLKDRQLLFDGTDEEFIEQLREEGYLPNKHNITDTINPMKKSNILRRTFKSFLPSKRSRGGKRNTKHKRKNKKRSTYNNKK